VNFPNGGEKVHSVIPLENGIQVGVVGMNPGFHRGDDHRDDRAARERVEFAELVVS